MLALLSFLLCLVLPSWSYTGITYQNGYFGGRSADLILDDIDTPPVEVQLEWRLTREVNKGRVQLSEIQDLHLYNLISRALALPQLQLPKPHALLTFMDDTIPTDLLSPPAGNVMFSFEGISSKDFTLNHKFHSYSVSTTSRPYHPATTLATIITGSHPSSHGIVNEGSSMALVANLFDIFSGLYGKDVVHISGSSSKARGDILSSHKSSSWYWDQESGEFLSGSGDKTLSVSRQSLATHLLDFSLTFDSNYVTIGDVVFNLDNHADSTLFAELAFVKFASQYLSELSGRKSLAFHFASLPQIAEQYGMGSPQWKSAVDLVDLTVSRSIKVLPNCVTELVFLPQQMTKNLKDMEEIVWPIVSPYSDTKTFPQIYLTQDGKEKQANLCEQVTNALVSYESVSVFCPRTREDFKRAITEDQPDQPVPWEDVAMLHLVLWPMLILLAAAIWASIVLCSMPPDLGLYSAASLKKPKVM
eukprot:TRINITY_DN1247_c0_g1_i3.p1 TRINITY_DN1247_c0_g1~~TRINITY_DN1247_c0_g1_i3.p1  ORF type:complete len:474 (-),score=37.41 TRINITY_DN1247_c0_g1_i3:146-1567(-)